MTRGPTSVLYLFEGAFSLWRRRLKGVYAAARERGWHVEPVNADDEGVTSNAVLHFWRPDGVIVDGAALGRSGFSLADFKDIPIVYCDADEEIVTGEHYGVRHDSRAAVRLALDELIALRRESYGYVHYFTPQDWSDDREAAAFRNGHTGLARRGKVRLRERTLAEVRLRKGDRRLPDRMAQERSWKLNG